MVIVETVSHFIKYNLQYPETTWQHHNQRQLQVEHLAHTQ